MLKRTPSVVQDWGELDRQPEEGQREGERFWGTKQSRDTPTHLRRDNRKSYRGHSGTHWEPGPQRDFWETSEKQLRTEERRRDQPREIPPQNPPLTSEMQKLTLKSVRLRAYQHYRPAQPDRPFWSEVEITQQLCGNMWNCFFWGWKNRMMTLIRRQYTGPVTSCRHVFAWSAAQTSDWLLDLCV